MTNCLQALYYWEHRGHAGEFGQRCRLIDIAGAGAVFVDFLQEGNVRVLRLNIGGNPVEIHFAVRSFAVMEIVAEQAQALTGPHGADGKQNSEK